MNIKKMFLILLIIFGLSGCVNIADVNYDEIINMVGSVKKTTNTYKKGFQFYTPRGLEIASSGPNYVIFNSSNVDYYMYIDLVSYNEKKEINHEIDNQSYYATNLDNNGNKGYVEIKLNKNNQYLIEIMYNYAKIEVMVDENYIKDALINSINILTSVKYNDKVIEKSLKDDNLDYTEEIFDKFKETNKNSSTLDYVEEDNSDNEEVIVDTDYIN